MGKVKGNVCWEYDVGIESVSNVTLRGVILNSVSLISLFPAKFWG